MFRLIQRLWQIDGDKKTLLYLRKQHVLRNRNFAISLKKHPCRDKELQ